MTVAVLFTSTNQRIGQMIVSDTIDIIKYGGVTFIRTGSSAECIDGSEGVRFDSTSVYVASDQEVTKIFNPKHREKIDDDAKI